MTTQQRFRLEMLVRARDFGTTHSQLFPESSIGGKAFAAIAAAILTIEQYLSRRVVARADARKVRVSARKAVREYLKRIARAGERITAAEGGSNPFRLPRTVAITASIVAGRAFIAEATSRQEAFVERGLPPTFLKDLGALVDELEKAAAVRLNSRTDLGRAREGVAEAVRRGLDAIRELDVLVPNAFVGDSAQLAAWESARHIEGVNARRTRRTSKAAPAVQTTDVKASEAPALPVVTFDKAS